MEESVALDADLLVLPFNLFVSTKLAWPLYLQVFGQDIWVQFRKESVILGRVCYLVLLAEVAVKIMVGHHISGFKLQWVGYSY